MMMEDDELKKLLENTASTRLEDIRLAEAGRNRIVARMIRTGRGELERFERRLTEMPLSVVLYHWTSAHLKHRPWRLLVPASLLLTLILQGVLSKFPPFFGFAP